MHRKKFFLIAVIATIPLMVVITRLVVGSASNSASSGPATSPTRIAEDKQQLEPLEDTSAEVRATLPFFYRLNQNYVRGSQPARGGVGVLSRLGVKTIVDLRSTYDHTPEIKTMAERLGLNYRWMPTSVWNPPTDAETGEFLSLVTDESKGPFFVFCADGVNRIGEMSAIYRVVRDGWSVKQSVEEMDKLGFNPYYYTLRNYVWTYARKSRPLAVPASGRRVSPIEQWEDSTKLIKPAKE